MRKKFFLVFLFVNLLLSFSNFFAISAPKSEKIKVSAKSAIAVELNSDQILFQKNVNSKRPIASTTKVMTALIALERLPLTQVLTATPEAVSVGEAEIYLEPGETMTVENLLYSLLLRSANDAAMVLAEGKDKNRKHFIRLMNKKARALGALNSNFTNPHGLYDGKHYSTAYDLYLISREALKNPFFAKVVGSRSKIISGKDKTKVRKVVNHNKLVLRYDYIKGVKTGYTSEAGYCLIALAELNNLKILTVVLGSPTSEECYQDTLSLINYIALNYSYQNFLKEGEVVAKIFIENGDSPLIAQAKEDLSILYSRKQTIISDVSIKTSHFFPIEKESIVGSFKVIDKQTKKVLGETKLVAQNQVKKKKFKLSPNSFFSQALSFLSRILNFF